MTDAAPPADPANPAEPAEPAPPAAPGIGRALSLLGLSVALTLLVFGSFYLYQTHARELTPSLLSAAISIVAIGVPTVIACYWPREGAPGRLPSYQRPERVVMAGAFFVSLPLYALSAAVLLDGSAWEPAKAAAAQAQVVRPSVLALGGMWLAFALLPAAAEELMYRGVIQPAITQRWGPAWGIGVTAALFSFIHMEPAGLLPRMLMGAWFGYLAWRTRSLWTSTWAHALNNTWGVLLLAAGQSNLAGHATIVAMVSLASLVSAAVSFHYAGWMGTPPVQD